MQLAQTVLQDLLGLRVDWRMAALAAGAAEAVELLPDKISRFDDRFDHLGQEIGRSWVNLGLGHVSFLCFDVPDHTAC